MSALTVDDILSALEHAGQRVIHRAGYHLTNCVLHDDRRPSLSFGEGHDGGAFIRCHAGCPTVDVVAALRALGATGTAPQLVPEELARRRAERDQEVLLREARAREIHATSLRHPDRELALEVISSTLRWDVHNLLCRGVGWNGARVVFPIIGGDGLVHGVDCYAAPGTRARQLVNETHPKLLAYGTRGLWPAPATVEGDVVLLVEGAPCAASVLAAGFACVAFPSASGLRLPIGAERLRGRQEILVLADADAVGRRGARTSALLLRDLKVPAKAISLFPGRNDGHDVGDELRARPGGADWLRRELEPFIDNKEEFQRHGDATRADHSVV